MIRLFVPLLVLTEIASLIVVGRGIGVLATLLLVVLAALLGAAILRRGGGDAMRAMRRALEGGRDPRAALLRGGFRVAAALLLIFPGFLGDLLALLLLLPPVQQALAAGLARRGLRAVAAGRMDPGPAPPPRPPSDRRVDEADWEEVAPPKRPTHRPSGWTRH